MMSALQKLFSLDFEPHSAHFFNDPWPMWLMIIGNGLAFIAYFFIPVVIIYFIRKRKDLYLNWMVLLFGAFIFLCGITHLIHALIFWYPAYYFQATISVATFIVSIATAIALLYFLPIIVTLTSPEQLEATNKRLAEELKNQEAYSDQIRKKRDDLAAKKLEIEEKNAELQQFNEYMELRNKTLLEKEEEYKRLKKDNV